METRMCWTSQEHKAVVDKAAELIVQDKITINFESGRVYGLSEYIRRAQVAVIAVERRRPKIETMVTTFKADIKHRVAELKGNGHAAAVAETSPTLPAPPETPNILGLDPKFAESLAYVLQQVSKALGAEFGKSLRQDLREGMRDALYDMKHHLGTAPGYVPPTKPEPIEPTP